ncbi:MAG: hypothetical protein SFU99_15200 [Saprospiraceae bacterium]|nr:hypothetical protein [Saprospiraceae bacterium]
MEKIRLGIFDVFGQIVPGLLQLIALIILANNNILNLSDAVDAFSQITTNQILLSILASFILSFSINSAAYFLYKNVGKRIFKRPLMDYTDYKSDIILVREFSPKNLSYIDEWTAKSAMSYNLSLGFLILLGASFYKLIIFGFSIGWILISLFSIVVSFILLKKAVLFQDWYLQDLQSTVRELYLKEKAKQFAQIKLDEKN